MLPKLQKKQRYLFSLLCLVLSVVLIPSIYAVTIAAEETIEGTSIKLLDVSIGETEEESACIFEINGKIVVVNRREKETYDGVTIWVKEVYAVNSKDKASDRCEFIYSFTEVYEDPIKKETIGEEVVHFLLGARTEMTNTEEVEQETASEEEISTETRVLVDGHDVTAGKQEDSAAEAGIVETEDKGIVSSFFGWLFS